VATLLRSIYALSGSEIALLCVASMMAGMVAARWVASGWRR
jgi:hypothetical protein